ncbi:S8 family peptidase, partial [Oscillatoriales cyanobacterium LEGE 11467]
TYGVAKKVRLVSVRVLGVKDRFGRCHGSGDLSGVVAGLDWISQNAQRPAVVNMSLGAEVESTVLDLAVKKLVSQGIVVVTSAGNENRPVELMTPARVPEAITVGATNDKDEKPNFSNWGSGVDVFAPGVFIKSAWYTADDDVREMSGTSMAAPHVAGFVALLLGKNPYLTPARIENIVKDHATKGLVRGLENFPGTPNRLLSIRHVPDLTDFARLDPYFYLAMNPDVSAAVGGIENYAGGATHWAAHGVHQGRMSSPAHWPGYYFYLYSDLANFFGHNAWSAAHNHWYHSGRGEGRSGSPAFNPFFYFSLYPELEGAFGKNNFRLATDHWIHNGIDEGRTGSVAFDPFFYLAAHGDVRAVVGEGNYRKALLHWFQYGINEGRRASWFFDPVAYFQHNPDLAGVFGATNYKMGMFHYIKHGQLEGRRAVP